MNKIIYAIALISFLGIIPQMALATDKAVFNEYADLMQPDTVGMTMAQIKEQFNQPAKQYDGDLGKIWQYDGLTNPDHPEYEHNNSCRVYFKQDKVHQVKCSKN